MQPVSRGYYKLKHALSNFNIELKDKVCADFGSSTGGFIQAILEENPETIYSIETSKNRLHFALKNDKKIIIMDNINAIYVHLPKKANFISIDVGWTPQKLVIPNAIKNLKEDGLIISLIKPHYESKIKNPDENELRETLNKVSKEIEKYAEVIKIIESPIKGNKGKNTEYLALIKPYNKTKE